MIYLENLPLSYDHSNIYAPRPSPETVFSAPSTPAITMQPMNNVASPELGPSVEKKRKISRWSSDRKDKLLELLVKFLIEVNTQQSEVIKKQTKDTFYKLAAPQLKTTPAACYHELRRLYKDLKAKDLSSNWLPEQIKRLVEIVSQIPSLKEGYDAASREFGKTPDECKHRYQAAIIGVFFTTINNKKSLNTDPLPPLNSSTSLSSSTREITTQAKKRVLHKWTDTEEESLKNIFHRLLASGTRRQLFFELAAKKFNEIHKTELTAAAISKKIVRLKYNLRSENPPPEKMEWTEEAKDVVFEKVVEYVFSKSKKTKGIFYSEIGDLFGIEATACSSKLRPNKWFSKLEQQLLEKKWSDQQEKSLVETVRSESTQEEGYLAAAKKFQIDVSECQTRFQNICIRRFKKLYMGGVNVSVPAIDDQKSRSTQFKATQKRKKAGSTDNSLKRIKTEVATAVESLLSISNHTP